MDLILLPAVIGVLSVLLAGHVRQKTDIHLQHRRGRAIYCERTKNTT